MNPFHWLKDYFQLSRREMNGFAVLILVLLLIVFGQYYLHYLKPLKQADFSEFDKMLAEWKAAGAAEDSNAAPGLTELEKPVSAPTKLFRFDPNTLPENGLLSLGLPQNVVQHILHYREKGGQFRKPEDLQRIYGLSETDYQRLRPYLSLPDQPSHFTAHTETHHPSRQMEKRTIDINTADSAMLVELKGIGPAFAGRIVRYRNRLGGFYAKEQLHEVFGIDSSRYPDIAAQLTLSPQLHRININTATFDELKTHPYLRYKLANAIIQYRRQHGLYHAVEDLKKIYLMDEGTFTKLQPYLVVE